MRWYSEKENKVSVASELHMFRIHSEMSDMFPRDRIDSIFSTQYIYS